MCTMISMQTAVSGSGKGSSGWFPISQANVGFDHATHTQAEHALLLDFVNPAMGAGARVAIEMDLASGRALVAQLQATIEEAGRSVLNEKLLRRNVFRVMGAAPPWGQSLLRSYLAARSFPPPPPA